MKTTQEIAAIRESMREKLNVRYGKPATDQYRKHVLICGGTGCTSSDSPRVRAILEEELKANGIENEVKVIQTGCFGLCALGPIMIVYPEGTFYSRVNKDEIHEIVTEHLMNDRIVKHLVYQETVHTDGTVLPLGETRFYKKQKRVALRNCGMINPECIDEYIGTNGYLALEKVLTTMKPQDVIDTILASGLRGRGGLSLIHI